MYASTLPRSNWLRRASIRLAWYRHMPASSFIQWSKGRFFASQGRHVVSINVKFGTEGQFFCDFWGCRPTFFKPEQWNLVWGCGLGTPSSTPIFIFFKSQKGVYPFLANLYQELPILAIFYGCKPTFHTWQWLHKGAGLGVPPQAKFCKNRLRGYTPFGQIYTKNYIFQRS